MQTGKEVNRKKMKIPYKNSGGLGDIGVPVQSSRLN